MSAPLFKIRHILTERLGMSFPFVIHVHGDERHGPRRLSRVCGLHKGTKLNSVYFFNSSFPERNSISLTISQAIVEKQDVADLTFGDESFG